MLRREGISRSRVRLGSQKVELDIIGEKRFEA